MKTILIQCSFVTIAILIFLCGCTSAPTTHGIPNFSQVAPDVYRGGQPTYKGWKYLHSLGVRNVVKLNSYAEGDSDNVAVALGMRVYCLPISLCQQTIGEPDRIQLREAVALMMPIDGPVFVHCSHGEDRTGLVVAQYRVHVQGWTRREAESEMMEMGFNPWLRGLYWGWEDWNP